MQKQSSGGVSFLGYLKGEVTRGYVLQENEEMYSEKQKRVLTFMRTPRELEKLMLFGVAIMFDSFLLIFSFLPLRVIWASLTFIFRLLTCRSNLMDSAHKWDIARGLILVICIISVGYVDTSQVYHLVRGQSVIKLYVIFNMLDIFDRLLASIGQDVLDSFYWVLSECGRSKTDLFPVGGYGLVATAYVFIHSVLVLCQVVTLNVAINSHNKALLTVMISNQFVELKGNVFKKFDVNNLFQMSSSDIRERFHYIILLTIVVIRNLAQFQWDLFHLQTLLPLIAVIFLSEIFVDWIKHGFITKFNSISPHVYRKYTAILAKDLATSRHRMSHSQYSAVVSRRMGFTPLPLTCLLSQTLFTFMNFRGVYGKLLLCIIFLCLLSLKTLLGIVLLGVACGYKHKPPDDEDENIKEKKKETRQSNSTCKEPVSDTVLTRPDSTVRDRSSKTNKTKSLSDIERYTLCSNRIV